MFFVLRFLFYSAFAFFFIEFNRWGLTRRPMQGALQLIGWLTVNMLLYGVIIGLFVVLVMKTLPNYPVLVAFTAYFRGFFIWLVALLIGYFLNVLDQNRTMLAENERLKQQTIQAQFNALRDQLNPHFLFNSLNTLSSLIREHSELSQPFVQKLSQVLRYSLQVQQQKLVPIAEERQFTAAFAFLLHMRFGEQLRIIDELPDNPPWLIPPMTLQLLIENAVKHNVISRARPLTILMQSDDAGGVIRVSNPYQPKAEPTDGTGTGLANLDTRIKLLTGQSIRIACQHDTFTVSLPIILKQA
ncbi:hypothetical protein BLX24_25925 [Arsenicibacter rosenii]|uniref:Signal transduction histidine kinase internal region domain-containing protein n=1 Tax=Arsenicibacter rosenii TaxID=1750698 RepID=A0A1S2VEA1_9BACT|nr:hypothetical protein BLX24_25925 [Arsenicibacter rosenii]